MPVTYQYLRQASPLHSMDALSKLTWLVVVSLVAFLLGSPLLLAIQVAVVAACGLVLGRVPVLMFVRGTAVLFILGLGMFLFQVLFQHHGDPVATIGPFTAHSEGIRLGLVIGLRITLVSVVALVFIWTTNPRDLIVGLVHLGVPYRVAYAIFVAFQFVPLLEEEARVIREAHLVRGVSEVSGRVEAWKRYAVPLLAYAIRKAETAAIAMDSRAFGAYPKRTFVDGFAWTPSGLVFLLASLGVEILLIAYAIRTGGLLGSYGAL